MSRAEQADGNHNEVLTVDREGLLRLIDEEARQLGLSGEKALEMVQKGQGEDNYLWSDISLLADLLSHTK